MAARRAIEFSHGKLDPALQKAILLLAPFTASIPVPFLDVYIEALQSRAAVGEVDMAAAVEELKRVGLASKHPIMANGWIQVVPILPYFLRNRLRDNAALHEAAGQAHYELYAVIAPTLEEMLTGNDPQQRATGRAAVRTEYANLTAALDHAQRHGEPVLGIIRTLDFYLEHVQQHGTRRQLLDNAIAKHPPAKTPQDQWQLLDLHNMAGETARAEYRLDDAHAHYTIELSMKQALGDRQSEAVTYHQLGIIAQQQRRYEEAERRYRQALDIKLEFNDRLSIARTYHQLGMVVQHQGRLEQAEQQYRQALDIKLEFNDRHSAGLTYHQLGVVAQKQGLLDQAEQHYRQALDISLEFGDRHGTASTYEQLGMVAQDRGRLDQAEQRYRQALDIKLEFNDRHGAAFTYHQLGVVAQNQGRPEQAEQRYRQALDIQLEFNDRYSAALTYYQLGRLITELERHHDGARALLSATTLWAPEEGGWMKRTVDLLRRLREHLPADDFAQLVAEIVPADRQPALTAALEMPDPL